MAPCGSLPFTLAGPMVRRDYAADTLTPCCLTRRPAVERILYSVLFECSKLFPWKYSSKGLYILKLSYLVFLLSFPATASSPLHKIIFVCCVVTRNFDTPALSLGIQAPCLFPLGRPKILSGYCRDPSLSLLLGSETLSWHRDQENEAFLLFCLCRLNAFGEIPPLASVSSSDI
jgi:hypothetical protein